MSYAFNCFEQTILVIDDEPTNLRVITNYLEKYGCEIMVSRDGRNGLEKAKRGQPDLILLDIMMPGLDGFETCELLKQDSLTKTIPVIFMSALSDAEDIARGFGVGAVDYITKPFQQAEMLARIGTHLHLNNLHKALIEKNQQLEQELLLRKETEKALRASRARFERIFNNAAVGIAVLDTKGRYLQVNDKFLELFGFKEENEILNQYCYDYNHPDFKNITKKAIYNISSGQKKNSQFDERLIRKDGSYFWVNAWLSALYDEEGKTSALVCILIDLTQRIQAEEKIRLYAKVFESSSSGIMITDKKNNIVAINPAFEHITGYIQEEVIGRNPNFLSSGKHSLAFYKSMWSQIIENGRWQGEIWNKRKDGSFYPEWLSIVTLKDVEEITHHVAIFSDIGERKKAEALLEYQATHDLLTHLPNRKLFQDRLDQALLRAKRELQQIAILFIELEYLKNIENQLSHEISEGILKEIARRLRNCIYDSDTIARLGGNEFGIILPYINHFSDAESIAKKILLIFKDPVIIQQESLQVVVNIGIALFPLDGQKAAALLKHADVAMYTAKQKGGDCFYFYSNALNSGHSL